MARQKDKGRLAPFVPVDQEMMCCAAWRATSHGARWLYVHLKRRWSFKQRNNGRLYLSQRDAGAEMGAHRDSIGRWYRELQHYGFIVMTRPGSLGVDGKGLAPHWRLTELEAANGNTWMLPTKDYLRWSGSMFQDDRGAVRRAKRKQNPGPQSRARVARKPGPGMARKPGPVPLESGPQSRAIENGLGGPQTRSISRYTTPISHSVDPLAFILTLSELENSGRAFSGKIVGGKFELSTDPRAYQVYHGVGRHTYQLSTDPRAMQQYGTLLHAEEKTS
jgi:hypothetical protein